MKYQQVRDAIDRIENARMDLDAGTKSLRALGVTDLPGDAPTSPAPVLPWRPSWEMIAKARSILTTRVLCDESIEAALSAAAAVAPKPAPIAGRVAEPTPEPVRFAFDDDAPKPAPGNLPGEPTNEMLRRAVDTARDVGEPVQAGTMHAALSAALAAAPKPAPAPAPGSLPLEPTDEMVEAGRCRDGDGDAYGAGMVREILRAALAAAPRVEVPEFPAPTPADAVLALRKFGGHGEGSQFCQEQIVAMLGALRAVRVEQIARMGAKS